MESNNLKELAMKATPGPWWIDSHGHRMVSHAASHNLQTVFVTDDRMGAPMRNPETGNLSRWPNDWDASFIAAANPAAVLELIAQRDELLAALKGLYKMVEGNFYLDDLMLPAYELAYEVIAKCEVKS